MLTRYQNDTDGYYTVSFELELGVDSPVLANASVTIPYASGASEDTPWVIDGSVFLYASNGDSYPQATSGAGTFRLVASADGFILTNRTGENWQPGDTLRFTVPYEVEVFSIPTDGAPGQILTRVPGGSDWQDAPENYPDGGEPGQVLALDDNGDPIWMDFPADVDEVPDTGTPGYYLRKTASGVEWAMIAPTDMSTSLRDDAALFERTLTAKGVAITAQTAGTVNVQIDTASGSVTFTNGQSATSAKNALAGLFTALSATVPGIHSSKAFLSGRVAAGLLHTAVVAITGTAATIAAVDLRVAGPVEERVKRVETGRWDLVGFDLITASGTWDRNAAITAKLPGVAYDDIRLDIDVIGGGASGFNAAQRSGGNKGGNAGGVTRIRMSHPDEIAASVTVVIGAGGATINNPAGTLASTNNSNAGGDTSFGNMVAKGGKGDNSSRHSLYPVPSDVSLGIAGDGAIFGSPSFGPGAGGGGGNGGGTGSGGNTAGMDGGANNSATRTSGGVAATPTTVAGNGANAVGAYDFGSGGGGGQGDSSVNDRIKGAPGGFPGGGGGGGARCFSGDNPTLNQPSGGAGGNGVIRVRYFKRSGA